VAAVVAAIAAIYVLLVTVTIWTAAMRARAIMAHKSPVLG
jgi:hypothetical protein